MFHGSREYLLPPPQRLKIWIFPPHQPLYTFSLAPTNCKSRANESSSNSKGSTFPPPSADKADKRRRKWRRNFSMVFAFYHQPPSRQILEKMVVERFPHSFHFSPLDVIAPLKTWGTLLTWTQRNKLKTIGQNIPGPLFETNIKRVVTNEAASHPLDSKHVFILISLVYKMNERCSSELKTSLSLLPSLHFICDRIPTVSRNKKGSLKELLGARKEDV